MGVGRQATIVALVAGLAAASTATPVEGGRFAGLALRELGPAVGGRVARAVGVPGDPRVYYAATAQGGVWKSEDGGFEWSAIFDDVPVASIGSIAVAPSDPNVVWVGTGEANIRGNVIPGRGIWRSTDAGDTWTRVWSERGQIGALAVHPRDPEVAFAAVLGDPFRPGPGRGVFRTLDGGASWERVLFIDEETGASDVAIDPGNPRIVWAGTWPARRTPWDLTSGGPTGGLWRSVDGGTTWKRLGAEPLPTGDVGRVGVGVAPSDGRRVYALIEAEDGGLFRSDDGGGSWERVNAHRSLRQRAFYYSTLVVDPLDPETIWFPQVPLLVSIDGGRTIRSVGDIHHGDVHDVWIDPRNPKRMIVSTDGGVELSLDGGESWRWPELGIAQVYNLDADHGRPYRVGGTFQDFGTASGPSNSLREDGIQPTDWREAGGGEAGDFVYDPFEPGVVYAGEYMGILTVHDETTGVSRNVSVLPESPSGLAPKRHRHRFQWTAPIAVSPHEPDVLFHAAEVLFRSRDRGATWERISPDLTRDDESKQGWAGGPITGDNSGVEVYGTIFSLALSPHDPETIWAGTDDGRVHVTRDGGGSWTEVTPPELPEWGTVDSIELSRHAAGTAWIAVQAYRLGDPAPYLFATEDGGRTWRSRVHGLPPDEPLFVVREDPARAGLLYAGTELGLHVSFDGGRRWEPLDVGLPPVKVTDLEVREDDLVVATSGRGIWILDDLSALRQWREETASLDLHLFEPAPAVLWRLAEAWGAEDGTKNPPAGVVVHYWLREKAEDGVTLEVLDERGRQVRELSSVAEEPEFAEDDPDEPTKEPKAKLSAEPGLHRAVWDFEWAGARRPRGIKIDLGDPTRGPRALPGRYTLRLRVGDHEETTEVEVLDDPRSRVRRADLEAQLEAALELRARLDLLADQIDRVRSIRDQAEELAGRLGDDESDSEVRAVAEEVARAASGLEERLHNPHAEIAYDIFAGPRGAQLHSKLAFLWEMLLWGDGAPTQGVREAAVRLCRDHDQLTAELAGLESGPLGELDRLAGELDLPRVVLPGPVPVAEP